MGWVQVREHIMRVCVCAEGVRGVGAGEGTHNEGLCVEWSGCR